MLLLAAAAYLGNTVNYFIGRAIGPRVFQATNNDTIFGALLNRKYETVHLFAAQTVAVPGEDQAMSYLGSVVAGYNQEVCSTLTPDCQLFPLQAPARPRLAAARRIAPGAASAR